MMFQNISNFNKTSDYLPLFNAVLITDLIVILLLNTKIIRSLVLKDWYNKYNLSAVIADVFIIFIGLIITRFFYHFLFDKFSLWKFILLSVIVQITHDILFYYFFKNVPRGMNRMMDTFKDYAKEASYKAILADSGMMISSCILASYLASQSLNVNLIVFIVSLYFVPYFIYQ
jgi:uncharacterized protein YacL